MDHPSLHIIICENGIRKPVSKGAISSEDYIKVFFFLVNASDESRQQLRMLSRIIDIVERDDFLEEMLRITSHREIKEFLLHNERFITVQLLPGTVQGETIGKPLKEVKYPSDV